jgi:esterase/lipase superfamily enzyme
MQASVASRRAVLRGVAASGGAFAVAGCAGMAATAPNLTAVAAIQQRPVLLVATTRKPVNGAHAKPWFGPDRAAMMSVARVRLLPPEDGRFSLGSDWRIADVELVSRVNDLIDAPTGASNVLLYIHGFNQTFETTALDAVRLSDGISFAGATMAFSWPSKAKLLDYGYDRESAMWSRDALDQLFDVLIASPAIGRVQVVAHSVGTMLTMEALRQLYARRGDAAAERIGAIVLASPDVDMDVFSSSIKRIGPLAANVTVVTATNDRALALSRWIAGGITRVGAAEKAQLERLGLRVIDASGEGWGLINHDLFLSNAQIRQVIRGAIEGRESIGALPPVGPVPRTVESAPLSEVPLPPPPQSQ